MQSSHSYDVESQCRKRKINCFLHNTSFTYGRFTTANVKQIFDFLNKNLNTNNTISNLPDY